LKNPSKRSTAEVLSEDAQLREIDERHFLSQQIFFRRQEREWSQEFLAQEAGLTQAQVATLEAGQGNPTLRTLVKLALTFKTTIHDLMAPLEDESDGCTVEDREGAETLRKVVRHYRSREEGHRAEFRVALAQRLVPSTRNPQSVLGTRTAKHVAHDAQPSVKFNLRQAATLEPGELVATLEL
jgi:transcriptional regulator with XRE-family HTH domain